MTTQTDNPWRVYHVEIDQRDPDLVGGRVLRSVLLPPQDTAVGSCLGMLGVLLFWGLAWLGGCVVLYLVGRAVCGLVGI